MSARDDLEFPVWADPLPPPPRMTSEQYDRFLYETLFMGNRTVETRYDPVPAEFSLVKEDTLNERQIDER